MALEACRRREGGAENSVRAVSADSSLTACSGVENAGTPQKLLILDARSYTAAVANRAKGGGCECEGTEDRAHPRTSSPWTCVVEWVPERSWGLGQHFGAQSLGARSPSHSCKVHYSRYIAAGPQGFCRKTAYLETRNGAVRGQLNQVYGGGCCGGSSSL